MAERKAFLLRADPAVLHAIQQWADRDLRSLNGQIEFLLRQALVQARHKRSGGEQAELFEADESLEEDS